jgi:hypothetical protein
MVAKTPPSSLANLVDAGAVGVLPSTHSWTRTSTGCGPRPATSATPAPVATARHGRGRGTPAAIAASSRRTGPSNAATPHARWSRLNVLTANRPRLVDSRHDRCTALGPLVMATSGPVGVPSPKASAIGDGESSICPWLASAVAMLPARPSARMEDGDCGRAVCCVQKDKCHETVHRRKRYRRVRYGKASTANPRAGPPGRPPRARRWDGASGELMRMAVGRTDAPAIQYHRRRCMLMSVRCADLHQYSSHNIGV